MGINQSDDKAAKKDGIWNGNQTWPSTARKNVSGKTGATATKVNAISTKPTENCRAYLQNLSDRESYCLNGTRIMAAESVVGWTNSWAMMDSEAQKTAERTDLDHVLPPGFDRNRYISPTSTAASLSCTLLGSSPQHLQCRYRICTNTPGMEAIRGASSYADLRSQGRRRFYESIGRIHGDGTREPVYKFSNGGHFHRCVLGETDSDVAPEFQKPLIDPSKMVRLIS
ncbi:hypothetical protein DFH08DRAFT_809963 [Mycena albidolilacea]|uniref:Uncharacterized protein n=1 Tax=Mycena albidolilacea TaxID=1033008 RepID=A0AAD7EQY6_9AGAR|nr:hypothetical protein DFH08DRAFT_809963 [Mycena albidolilacea]